MAETTDFEALFDAEYGRCVAVARRLTGDRELASEIAAEAFARTWARWWRVRRGSSPGGFVMRVTVNLALDAVRRGPPPPERTSLAPPLLDDVVATRMALVEALRTLSERQREVVVMRHLVDLSEADVADHLDISPGSVKTHLSRGLAQLREVLDQEGAGVS